MQSREWILWNIFLAAIPVVLANALAYGAMRWTVRRKKVPWIAWAPLAILWLAFLPNTCYLITEWRHFLFDARFETLRSEAYTRHVFLLPVAKWGFYFLIYSGIGVVFFALSIRPIAKLLHRAHARVLPIAIPFFLLISLGVYLGLIRRFNSWDALRSPGHVLGVAADALARPLLLKTIVIFAGLLWVLYEIVDIWIDGLASRVKRWTRTGRA